MAIPEASNSSTSSPKLKQPGTGLPWWELLVARHLVFPRFCRKQTWASAAQMFQDEGSRVLAVFDCVPADRLGQRVVVRRFAGMEDSSRFWSATMAVEHLNMVGSAIRRTISILGRGEVPTVTPGTADFKPRGEIAPAEVRSDFVRMLTEDAAADQVEPPILPGVGPRYTHPWFGPLDAHQWHCLLAFHQGLHCKQIEAIHAGLGVS